MPADTQSPETQELPVHNFRHQISRNAHHSFKTKCIEILIQIFGHYGSVERETTSISHCSFVNEDIYRLHTIKWSDLDPLKCINPAKWIEGLIVWPLEMLSFSLFYLSKRAYLRIASILDLWFAPGFSEERKSLNGFQTFLLYFVATLLVVAKFILGVLTWIAPVVDLGVNIITGIVRRVLAPARYIVRPAIEMAMDHPKAFSTMVFAITVAAIVVVAMTLTGTLPVGAALLSLTLGVKLAVVAGIAIGLGSALTKGFTTMKELFDRPFEKTPQDPIRALDKRDQQSGYDFAIMRTTQESAREALNNYQGLMPLLVYGDFYWFVYGFSAKEEKILTKLENFSGYAKLAAKLPTEENTATVIHASDLPEDSQEAIYKAINTAIKTGPFEKSAHVQKRTGSTKKITEDLHHINIARTEVRPRGTYNKDWKFRLKHFIGSEAWLCPAGKATAPDTQTLEGSPQNFSRIAR